MPVSETTRNSSAAEGWPASHASKKRKLRKGTQSCWECKRRKIRCTFATPTEAICDGCRSRRTQCISQEYHDDAASIRTRSDRLSRVESLVEQLVGTSPNINDDAVITWMRRSADDSERDSRKNRPEMTASVPPVTYHDLDRASTLDEVSRALLAVWPNQDDIDLILSVPVSVSVLWHGIICMPYSTFFSRHIQSPRDMLQLPPRTSHPVLIARRLLMLASLLQSIPPCSAEKLAGLRCDYRTIMSRIVNLANRLVTSNDELVGSLEGIECVMMESMYMNNAGNLRRAWLMNRRAMSMAQMMGLNSSASCAPSTYVILDDETRDRIKPDYMWFRIVVSDRYLSMLLGLPQGTVENDFASSKAQEQCSALERMERIESVAAGLVLQRNTAEQTDLVATIRIDNMLQEAAALMSPQWWSMTPDVTAMVGNDAPAFQESIRLTTQIAHHHLLVQLHLPYMLQGPSDDPQYDYSRMTATNSSRVLVATYVSFHDSISSPAYCRGLDFVAFIAGTTLCLAHIEACRQRRTSTGKGQSVFQSLQHQRLTDRGLLERALKIVETMARTHDDAVAKKISGILGPLLVIENNSSNGDSYRASVSSEVDGQELPSFNDAGKDSNVLQIQIPYFGTIRIENGPASDGATESAQTLPTDAIVSLVFGPESAPNGARDEGQGGMTSASDWEAVPSYLDTTTNILHETGTANWDRFLLSLDVTRPQDPHVLVPGLAADVDDWALQGVDTAFFSSLTQVRVNPSEAESPSHSE